MFKKIFNDYIEAFHELYYLHYDNSAGKIIFSAFMLGYIIKINRYDQPSQTALNALIKIICKAKFSW